MTWHDQVIYCEDSSLDQVMRLAKTRGIVSMPASTTERHGLRLPTGTIFLDWNGLVGPARAIVGVKDSQFEE